MSNHEECPIVQQIPLRLIDTPKLLLREIDEQAVTDLTFSIKKNGILQPIQLRPKKDGKYELEMNPVKEGEIYLRLLNSNFVTSDFVTSVTNVAKVTKLQKKQNNASTASILELSREIGKCIDYIKTRIAIYQNLNPLLRNQIGKSLTITNAEMLSKSPKNQQEEIYHRMQESKIRLSQKTHETLFSTIPTDGDKSPTSMYCVCPQCRTKHVKGIRGMV